MLHLRAVVFGQSLRAAIEAPAAEPPRSAPAWLPATAGCGMAAHRRERRAGSLPASCAARSLRAVISQGSAAPSKAAGQAGQPGSAQPRAPIPAPGAPGL